MRVNAKALYKTSSACRVPPVSFTLFVLFMYFQIVFRNNANVKSIMERQINIEIDLSLAICRRTITNFNSIIQNLTVINTGQVCCDFRFINVTNTVTSIFLIFFQDYSVNFKSQLNKYKFVYCQTEVNYLRNKQRIIHVKYRKAFQWV